LGFASTLLITCESNAYILTPLDFPFYCFCQEILEQRKGFIMLWRKRRFYESGRMCNLAFKDNSAVAEQLFHGDVYQCSKKFLVVTYFSINTNKN